ncbi:MAG: glucose-6-phosphate isomerase [Rhodothermales bacterium]|jgi:glucose-6-phosphate isomerase
MIQLDYSKALRFLPDNATDEFRELAVGAHEQVLNRSGAGAEYLGWRDLVLEPDDALIGSIEALAAKIREDADIFLCIGIGGSYLGALAVIEALTPYFAKEGDPEIIFAGTSMSGAYLKQLLAHLEGKSVYVNVISKSGTTLEPAIAFRLIRSWMEETFDDADDRIFVTTDPDKGALNALRQEHPYTKFVIPPDVGGRFSVLTPVGLLPIAVAGVDIRSLFYGATEAAKRLTTTENNPAIDYALIRNLLLKNGFDTEVFATFEPCLGLIGGWWQQLFGESEGKAQNGLLPVSVKYSADLHSLGQYVQDGRRNLLETFLIVKNDGGSLSIPEDPENLDGLNYLVGKSMTDINRKAYEGTAKAHGVGGVPIMTLWIDDITPGHIGELLYFFEHAVAVGGYMLTINPFDQPGVEAYKKEMFRLLGRP